LEGVFGKWMRGCNLWLAGEKRKKEKKSWYQYVFLGFAGEDEATEEVRRIGASSRIASEHSA
jgi:hypothetical protein